MEPWLQIALMIALLVAVPAICALLLRSAAAPGSAVLGGVLAGILLGPTLFGRIAPGRYEAILVGGAEQRIQLERLVSRQGADLVAAEAARLPSRAIEEMRQQHAEERAPLEAALREMRWEHQRPLRIFTGTIVGIALLGAALFTVPKPARRRPWRRFPGAIISPLSIGLWSAAIPGALAYVCAVRWWGWSIPEAGLVAAAVMIGPWMLTRFDRDAADHAEEGGARMIETAGRVATLIAIIVAAWAMLSLCGWGGLVWMMPILAVIAGWLLPSVRRSYQGGPKGATEAGKKSQELNTSKGQHDGPSAFDSTTFSSSPWPSVARRGRSGFVEAFILFVIIPALAALAAIRIDLFAHFSFWPIVILLILSGDGRWVGAVLGALLLGGRSLLRTMRLAMGSMACGPTQLAVIAVTAHLWLLREEAVFALVAGALVIEVTVPLRRSMAKRLTEAEEWELE